MQALAPEGPQILTSSFSLLGDDAASDPGGGGGRGSAHYGYSKAHRPDLKQILMSLTSFDMSQARWVVSEGLEPDGIT